MCAITKKKKKIQRFKMSFCITDIATNTPSMKNDYLRISRSAGFFPCHCAETSRLDFVDL